MWWRNNNLECWSKITDWSCQYIETRMWKAVVDIYYVVLTVKRIWCKMYTTQYHRQSPGFVPSGQGEGRGKMVTHSDIQFIKCLQKFPHQRTDQDLDLVYSYLHGMEALSSLREPALRALCRTVRYEYHDANDILYCQGELSTCWYILLSGSVFIEGSMFLPRSR